MGLLGRGVSKCCAKMEEEGSWEVCDWLELF